MSRFQEPGDESPDTRRRRDLDDLQNEMAGRETGRQRRFLGADDERSPEGRERKERDEALTRLQMLLLNDPAYAKAYKDTFEILRNAENATEAALRKSEIALEQARGKLDAVLDRAQRLPDGTRVFRDASGDVYTEDGRRVEGTERDGIEWKDGAPGYEEFIARQQALEQARRDGDELRKYQVEVLGSARERMQDQDNPPTAQEMEEMKRKIDEQMPRIVKAEMPNAEPPPRAPVADLPIPALK